MGFAKVFNWLAAEPKDHYTLFGPNDMMRADFCRAARATERIVTVGGGRCALCGRSGAECAGYRACRNRNCNGFFTGHGQGRGLRLRRCGGMCRAGN